jgi:tetratricopeptide (TPR) repeat protein
MKLIIPSLLAATLTVASTGDAWQDSPTIKQLYESGRYQDVVNRLNADPGSMAPEDRYVLAQTHLKAQNGEAAKQALAPLLDRGENDPWARIARSERARIDQNLDQALSAAQEAVAQGPPMPAAAYAHFQLGLVQSQRQDMAGAADSFSKAAALDPGFAYAHYYAGMAFSSLKRLDRVAFHFEQFLKLAPSAPERGAVESIMRTLRGQ